MEIKRNNKNGLIIKGKKETIWVDPPENEKIVGRMVIKTVNEQVRGLGETVVIAGPGEYEVGGVAVTGVNVGGGRTIYTVLVDGVMVGILGEMKEELSDKKKDKVSSLDILVASIYNGGGLSGKRFAELAKTWGANILIPVGYEKGDENITKFLDETDNEALEPIEVYKIEKDNLPEGSEVVCLM